MEELIPVEEFQRLLGAESSGLNDESSANVRNEMYALANAVLDAFYEFNQDSRELDISEFQPTPQEFEELIRRFGLQQYDFSPTPENRDTTRQDWEDSNF